MAHYLKIILCTQNSPVIQDTSLPYRQTRVCRCASRIVEDVLSPPCFWRALGFECRRQRRHVDRDWRQQSPTMVYRVGCVFEIIRQRAHLVATRLPAHAWAKMSIAAFASQHRVARVARLMRVWRLARDSRAIRALLACCSRVSRVCRARVARVSRVVRASFARLLRVYCAWFARVSPPK